MKNIKKVFVLLFTITLLGIIPLSVHASEQVPNTTLTYAIEEATENANYMLVRNEPRMLNYTHIMDIAHLGGEYGSVDEPAVMEVNGMTTNVDFYIDILQADNTRIYAFDLPADAVMVSPPIPQGTELVSIQKNGYDVKIVLRLTGSTVVTALQPKTLGDEWFGVFRATWGPRLTIDYYGSDGIKITTPSKNEIIIDPWNPSVFDGNTLSYADASGTYIFNKYGSGIEYSNAGGNGEYDGIYAFYESVPPRRSSPDQTAVPADQAPAAVLTPIPETVPADIAAPAFIPETGHTPGDYLGDVLYSDIVAYINGCAIPTSITNGRTMVVAEDLRNYGFDVIWDQAAMSLYIAPNPNSLITPMTVEANTMPVGTVKFPYVYTNIKTFLSGEEVESFAIDGQTLIDFELLVKYGAVEWDQATRSLRLTVY